MLLEQHIPGEEYLMPDQQAISSKKARCLAPRLKDSVLLFLSRSFLSLGSLHSGSLFLFLRLLVLLLSGRPVSYTHLIGYTPLVDVMGRAVLVIEAAFPDLVMRCV